jgi:hypothetical protein
VLLRCPHCKDITSQRARTFPHCVRCGRLLAQCQYCLHYDAQGHLCRSPHQEEPTRVDPEALPTCGRYLSRLDPANAPLRRLSRSVMPYACVLLLAALLAMVGLHLWGGGTADQPAQMATLELSGCRELSGDEAATLQVQVRNTGRKVIRDLGITLGGDLFNACTVSLKPGREGREMNATADVPCYRFGLLKPGDTLQVELTLQPRSDTAFAHVRWQLKAVGDGGDVLAQRSSELHILP